MITVYLLPSDAVMMLIARIGARRSAVFWSLRHGGVKTAVFSDAAGSWANVRFPEDVDGRMSAIRISVM